MSPINVEGSRMLSTVTPPTDFSWRESAHGDAWFLLHGVTLEVVPFLVGNRREAVRAARRRGWRLFIVWTGRYRSDTFEADVLPDEGTF